LLFAAFSAALAYGMLIPVVPVYLAAAGAPASWHQAALPVVFLAAASLSAPFWGRLSDRIPRRRVLLCGLGGSVGALVPFLVQHSLLTLYAYQVIAGLAFGAVIPVALSMLYEDAARGDEARGIAWFNGSTLAGYLLGPALGGWTASLGAELPPHRALLIALALQALATLAALLLVLATTPSSARPRDEGEIAPRPGRTRRAVAAALLAAFLIGAFELSASTYARSPLHLDGSDVAWIFMACSAAMFAVQLALLPRLPPRAPRVRIAFGCVITSAVLLALMGWAQAHAALIAFAALQGAVLGLAVGLLSFDAAASGARRRGQLLGYQNAAVNAGQAAGSAAGAASVMALGAAGLAALGSVVVLAAALHQSSDENSNA
jgi:DHA1 family multidrug resistance protein-like MFS transporter